MEGRARQHQYVLDLAQERHHFDLMVAGAFVRGIRDLGYKSNAHGIYELVDNSEQAGAKNVHIAFGYETKSETKPSAIAILDDGHGMEEAMIRASVMWGGTHREDDRKGFGRFGYGLPSASVSIGKRFTVYSWIEGSKEVFSVTIDVDDISAGKYRDAEGRTIVPNPAATPLPSWVSEYMTKAFPGGMPQSGTVVLLEKLDRLEWKTAKTLREKLLDSLGVTYRNFLRSMSIVVDNVSVQITDPLFLTSGARFFNNDAEGLPPADFEVKDPATGKPIGVVKVRYSYLPPKAFAVKYSDPDKKDFTRARTAIRDQYNGLLILRNGRQLDLLKVLTHGWKRNFTNYDAFYKVEIDFPPTLDEEFSVTTSKQQAGLSPRMWELLRQAGVPKMMAALYDRANKDLISLNQKSEDDPTKPRASEVVMAEVQKFRPKKPEATSVRERQESEKNFKEWIRKRAEAAKVPESVIEDQAKQEAGFRKWVVEPENLPGAPFYRLIPRGGQIVLLINEGHRFYQDVYAAFASRPQLRSGLEVLLFVIGECELDASDDRRRFYESERSEWSRQLNTALDRLREMDAADMERESHDDFDADPGNVAA